MSTIFADPLCSNIAFMIKYVTASSLGLVKESLEGYKSMTKAKIANPMFHVLHYLARSCYETSKIAQNYVTCPPKSVFVHYTLENESCKPGNNAKSAGTGSHSVRTSSKNTSRRRSGSHNRICGSRLETGKSWT